MLAISGRGNSFPVANFTTLINHLNHILSLQGTLFGKACNYHRSQTSKQLNLLRAPGAGPFFYAIYYSLLLTLPTLVLDIYLGLFAAHSLHDDFPTMIAKKETRCNAAGTKKMG